MTFNEIKDQIVSNKSRLYPKKLITENINIINQHYNNDLSNLKINQIGQIIKNNLNILCICGKLKTWDNSIIQLTCGDNYCRTQVRQSTTIVKYGVKNVAQKEEFKDKIQKTNHERYGTYHYTQSYDSKEKYKNNEIITWYNKHILNIEDMNYKFITDKFIKDNVLDYDKFMIYFNIKSLSNVYLILKKFNIVVKKFGPTSYAETEINNYIQSLTQTQIVLNDRTIIKPVEIDLYLPNHDLAIEYNGLYWHSYGLNNIAQRQGDKRFQTYRHVEKTNQFEKLSESHQIFHIFENEWSDDIKKDIWKSMISDKLKVNEKVYARNTIVKEVSSKEANEFILNNHIQGIRNASIRLGLYKDNKLLSIMTFGKPINKSDSEYELVRFCNKKFTSVIGGASKLLKHFEKTYKPKSLLSYANRRWSRGNLYHKLGFELQNISKPNKFVFHSNDSQKLYNRISFQKHKLEEKLEKYDSTIGADENIINNNYRIIWDSGNYIFIKTY